MSELQLRQDILDELEFELRVNAAHIGVAVENRVVTLTGHVSSYDEKLQAVQAVRRVKGVQAIAEEIEVRFLNDKKTSDDEIAKRAVKQAEVAHPGMMGDGTEEQNLGQRGNPAARIKKDEVDAEAPERMLRDSSGAWHVQDR